ncbi:hypothetical protein BD413DRAFT_673846, partial [Trametes elegans]
MSRTTTVAPSKSSSRSTSALLLSKSRRIDEGDPSRSPRRENKALAGSGHVEDENSSSPTPTEIHRWTFTRAAIAPCFIRDVFEMRDSGSRGMEFFWLGRIPCRTVCFVGLVVGVQVWEKRTVYTIDDNTAVVDCAYAHPQAAPPSPVKPTRQENVTSKTTSKVSGSSLANYLPRARSATTSVAPSKRAVAESPPPPKPLARVGQPVCVVGRVVNRHDTRLVLVDKISVCASFNDEPSHWLAVAELHRTSYHPTESLPPFIPPRLPSTAIDNTQLHSFDRPDSPRKLQNEQHVADPGTAASVCSPVASTNTSPSTVASTSSPASRTGVKAQSPIRLRHPARLHTRDLTVHTLRIYIKHYMDNAPPPRRSRPHRVRARSTSPSPITLFSQARSDALATSTNSTRPRAIHDNDATPRPSRSRPLGLRPASRAALSSDTDDDTDHDGSQPSVENDDQVYGYTLSHLRRVPELSLLARRIVHAEAHRRAKEERKRVKAKAEAERSKPRNKSTSAAQEAADPVGAQEPKTTTAAAMKRLFRQAIRTLFQDGSIVLWDGPVRPPPPPALDPLIPSSFSSALWKANSS